MTRLVVSVQLSVPPKVVFQPFTIYPIRLALQPFTLHIRGSISSTDKIRDGISTVGTFRGSISTVHQHHQRQHFNHKQHQMQHFNIPHHLRWHLNYQHSTTFEGAFELSIPSEVAFQTIKQQINHLHYLKQNLTINTIQRQNFIYRHLFIQHSAPLEVAFVTSTSLEVALNQDQQPQG